LKKSLKKNKLKLLKKSLKKNKLKLLKKSLKKNKLKIRSLKTFEKIILKIRRIEI